MSEIRRKTTSAGAIHERRVGQKPVPDDLLSRLNELQRLTIRRLEAFGWKIRFVRRPSFTEPVVVVTDPSGKDSAVVDEHGHLDRSTKLDMR
jgi:hypothetical protein